MPTIEIINFLNSEDFRRYLPLINSKMTLVIRWALKEEATTSILPPVILFAAKIAKIGMMAFQDDQRIVSEIIKALTMGLI